ncbi:MAG: sulfatase-like hydrolase/transferase [Proteobacteria bacterium]|nr:sulfatase-like hydrolase/transferase [Pseudomonadota bacterium]
MELTRRNLLKTAAIGAASLATGCGPNTRSKSPDKPNILWLVSEDNSPLLGCYGDANASTPNLDSLAKEGIAFDNAFANAPVCAPARNTLITGMYSPSLGNQNMRSSYPIPRQIRFFPEYLREAGYYCTNKFKTDYNCKTTPKGAWDRNMLSWLMPWRFRKEGQPFFHVINTTTTHESGMHTRINQTEHHPDRMELAPYHPDTPEVRKDYAHYYDQVGKMDSEFGRILKMLEADGVAEDTIVFYYSDHGGVLPGSKRFLHDSGMRVPLIVRFPEKYQHLAPGKPGSRSDRLVSFVDFAPTVLSLAGIDAPDHMQGNAFLGEKARPEPEYVFGFADRMDARFDLRRAVVSRRFRYIRNYMPHRPYMQHLDYLWRAKSAQVWTKMHSEGRLNDIQNAFFEPKAKEELYDLKADPFEVNNLADDPKHRKVLGEMRTAGSCWSLDIRDSGFVHEAEMVERSKGSTIFEMVRNDQKYPLEDLMAAAEQASSRNPENLAAQIGMLASHDSGVRYWGAIGCLVLGEAAKPAVEKLKPLLNDSSPVVGIAAAEALCQLGDSGMALPVLTNGLSHENEMVRLYAVNALDYIDEKAKPVERLLRDNLEHQKDYTKRALKKLLADLEPHQI